MKMPTELQDAIMTGLQTMMALRLRGSPASDTLPATVKAWVLALTHRPIAWDADLDLIRIQKGFVELMATTDTWPSPNAFMERLPPRIPQLRLEHKTPGTMSPETRKMLDDLYKKMKRRTAEPQ